MNPLRAIFQNRDFTETVQPIALATPTFLSWHAIGGPELATIELNDLKVNQWTLQSLLRAPVRVVDLFGRLVWWGFVSSVQLPHGNQSILLDLDPMANKVGVVFTLARPGAADAGIYSTTSWANNLDSQGIYGIKERLVKTGPMSSSQAAQRMNAEIAATGWPVASLLIDKPVRVPTLTCRGWWSSLAWRYWSNGAGLIDFSVLGTGVQSLGNAAVNTTLAQQFTPFSSWSVERAGIRAKKVGSPADNLVIALHNESGGFPTGSDLVVAIFSGASLSSTDYLWLDGAFNASWPLVQSTNYWLLIYRTGALDGANYYSIDVDEGCGYAPGVFKVYDGAVWQARVPNADMNFRLKGSQMTTDQVTAIYNYASQLLAGCVIETPSNVYASQYRDGQHTCQEEIKRILESGNSAGTRLLAEVTADRVLRVYSQQAAGSADYQVDLSGQRYAETGAKLLPYQSTAGRWLRLKEAQTAPLGLAGDPARAWVERSEWRFDGS